MSKVLIVVVGLAIVLACFVILIVTEILLVSRGNRLQFTDPSRTVQTFGTGAPLSYVVLGDSTGAGQGASVYSKGIAELSAHFLAENHAVRYVNLAVSGARARDVVRTQLPQVRQYKPDIVFLAVGANDVTHLTSSDSVRQNMQRIIDGLVATNCNVKIVLTGSPDMGSVPRFTGLLRALASWRTNQLNAVFTDIVAHNHLTFAPIAEKTGSTFRHNPALFAVDRFHPNDDGYVVWKPVVEQALQQAQASQPSHCVSE